MLRILSVVLVACGLAVMPGRVAAQQPAAGDSVSAKDIAAGKAVFEGKTGALCTTCHGANARGIQGLGPNLTDKTWLHGDGSFTFLRTVIRTGVTKPKQSAMGMPPMGGASLSDEQLRAVAAYVRSLSVR